jgi:predicted RNase H-like HicB family nuclease
MKYPFVVEPGDENHAFGVVVPDLPGCFSAGDTLDEAFGNVNEAINLWLEVEIDEGREIPMPSAISEIIKNPDYAGWIVGVADIDLSKLTDKTERLNICLPSRVLRRLDRCASKAGESRSGYLSHMILSHSGA